MGNEENMKKNMTSILLGTFLGTTLFFAGFNQINQKENIKDVVFDPLEQTEGQIYLYTDVLKISDTRERDNKNYAMVNKCITALDIENTKNTNNYHVELKINNQKYYSVTMSNHVTKCDNGYFLKETPYDPSTISHLDQHLILLNETDYNNLIKKAYKKPVHIVNSNKNIIL